MSLGNWGEEKAVTYLKTKGYKIIETNFSCKLGEVDIIAFRKGVLHFVEVKTRRTNAYGSPAESVTKQKLRHITKTIEFYLLKNKIDDNQIEISVDVIEIYLGNGDIEYNHIENITI